MNKVVPLAAFGAGYVLGSRAGRERYEQLRELYEKVKNDPRVQEQAHRAAETVRENAGPVAESLKERAGQAAGSVGSRAQRAADTASQKVSDVSSSTDPASEVEAEGRLNDERLRLDEQTGPRGDLP